LSYADEFIESVGFMEKFYMGFKKLKPNYNQLRENIDFNIKENS